ncbi:hypothetical protein D9758_005626 [Tetrapyrgos nigripes]|uniref:Uncharacterized protein n=1 Tax=Tetrapyrgos nigripes TaxID=182062 RepID=A0A8H5GGR5_9AGAR|nr:hypothetical protein D9758_005626 [Tetrapyrgos nigripes]
MSSSNSTSSCGLLRPEDLLLLKQNDLSSALEGVFFGILITLAIVGFYYLGRQGLFKISRHQTPSPSASKLKFPGLSKSKSTSTSSNISTSSKAKLILALLILFMTLSSTAVFISHVRWDMADISRVGGGDANEEKVINKLNFVAVLLARVTYVLSDAIVIWRAWALYTFDEHGRIVRLLLTICMIGTCTGAFVDAGFNLRNATNDVDGNGAATKYALYVPLLVTNLVATSLIGYKFWKYRKFLKHNKLRPDPSERPSESSGPSVEQILIILLESGGAFVVLWIISALAALGLFTDTGTVVVACIMPHLSSICPIGIIILVALHKSECENTRIAGETYRSHFEPNRSRISGNESLPPMTFTRVAAARSQPSSNSMTSDSDSSPVQMVSIDRRQDDIKADSSQNMKSFGSASSGDAYFISVGSVMGSPQTSRGTGDLEAGL